MPSSTFRDRGGLGTTGIFSDAPRALTFTIPSHSSSLHQATFLPSTNQSTKFLASPVAFLSGLLWPQSFRHDSLPLPHQRAVTTNFSQSLLLLFYGESTLFSIRLNHQSRPVFKMLRRAPTTIQLTQADIEQYEANRQRKLWEQQQQQQHSLQSTQSSETSVQAPQKSKKDRVLGGR